MDFFPIHLPSQLKQHLRALRKERGLTQSALGKLIGLGQARIAEIESNPGVVSVEQLMRVLAAMEATLVLRDDQAVASREPKAPATSIAPATPHATARSARKKPTTQADDRPVIRPKKGSW